MPVSTTTEPRERILSSAYAATTIAMLGLIAFVAFEAMAVATVMPTVARDLDGLDLYALAFAAPLASGVVGMVAAGMWSDRTGPVVPLLASMALFSAGLLVCGLAPSMEVLLAGRVLQGLGGGALTVGLYVLVGLCCGLAALMYLARTSTGSSTHGTLLELDAIAAVVIGGTLLTGGRGTIVGTVFGVLVFTTVSNIFALNNLSSATQAIAKGLIIVIAVLLH